MAFKHVAILILLILSGCAHNNDSKRGISPNSNDISTLQKVYSDLKQKKPDSINMYQYNNLILEYTNYIAHKKYELDSLIELIRGSRIPDDEYRTFLSHIVHHLGNSGKIDSAEKTLRHLYFSDPSENWSKAYKDYHWNLGMVFLKLQDYDCDSARYYGNELLQTVKKDSASFRVEEVKTTENIIELIDAECSD